MKKIIYLNAILFLLVLNFFSCEMPIGLGAKLNLDPPVVEILRPGFMENIGAQLEIAGTASDLEEVVHLNITIERVSKTGSSWKQEWHGLRGAWRSHSLNNSDWVSRDGIWITDGRPGLVNWSVVIPMEGAQDGEYVITVGAENNVSIKGAQVQRRVIIDTNGPVTKILLPSLEFEGTYDYYGDVYNTFSKYQLEDPSIMDKLFNQDIIVQYEVDDDFSIDTLAFQLADYEGNIYYNPGRISIDERVSWSGSHPILEGEIDLNAAGKQAPYFLQLISFATDKAGNEEIKSHGWFVYWPESDKPWVTGIGYSDPSAAAQNEVYPKSDLHILSYDDDGVNFVSYKIFRLNSSMLPVGDPVSENKRYNNPLVQGAAPSGFFSFGIAAPEESAMYRITLECEDINGKAGDIIYRYFFVMDISKPEINKLENPVGTATLFGDGTGTFRINGTVSDGINPVKLYLAWIKPGNNNDLFEYQSEDASVWDILNDTPAGTSSKKTDGNGNLLWNLLLTSIDDDAEDNRVYKSFDRNLNLFTDLGISEEVPLGTQTFIFRLEGQSGKAITRLYHIRGDIEPPNVLDIETITIRRAGASDNNIPASNFDDRNFQMPNLEVNDEIYLSGNWDDDSFREWTEVSSIKMGEFTVTWNGFDVPNAVLKADNKWEAGPFTLNIDEVLKGGGRIVARLMDLGGNMSSASLAARADTNVPVLMFISSENEDSSYMAGKEIDIYFEFNKEVRYTGSGAYLVLNIGGTPRHAVYSMPGDELSHTHHFKYTVQSGDNIDVLSVAGIVSNKDHWVDVNNTSPNIAIPTGRNLGDIKQIRLDTTAPLISGVRAMSDSGYYNEGKTIYILLSFDEPIKFIPGNPNTVLNLNIGSGPGAGRHPALMGQNALLFTYLVEPGDNSSVLAASGFTLGGGEITDIAGNILTAVTVPSGNNITNNDVEANRRNIVIDTLKPNPPLLNAAAGTFQVPQTFTITGENADAVLEYSINYGPWLTYRSEVTISSAATYGIRARQTDLAGNVSDPTATVTITINRQEALLQSLGGSNPGTYTVGQIVDVRINLTNRGTLDVSNNTLSVRLNIRNGGSNFRDVNINLPAGIDGSSLLFSYTVQNGDEIAPFVLNGNTVNTLEVIDLLLNSADITMSGNSINTELKSDWDRHGRQGLSFYTSINIRTDIPQLISAELTNDSKLVLTFSEDVYRGTGTITLVQAGTYLAPAVMSRNDYFRFGGNSLSPYYTIGTNGTAANGDPDLTEKYILNFNVEPDYPDLTSILTGAGASRVQIPVASGAVTIAGAVMTIDVSEDWGYNLRVKGVNYTLTLQNNIVRDEQNNVLEGIPGGTTTRTVANPGVNRPFIRVEKNRGSFNTEPVTFSGTTQTVPYWVNLTNAATSLNTANPATMPASAGTWRQVVQYRATGTYTSQRDQPTSNQDKFWQTPANNVTYWVSGATATTVNPNSNDWGTVANHWVHGSPTLVGTDPASNAYISIGAVSVNYFVKDANIRTTTQTGDNWARARDFTIQLGTAARNTGASSGIFISEPSDLNFFIPRANGEFSGNVYTNPGNVQVSFGHNPPGDWANNYLDFSVYNGAIWINPYVNTVGVGFSHGAGDFRVTGTSLWIDMNTAGIQRQTTAPAGEAGWIPVSFNEPRWLQLGTGIWHNNAWLNSNSTIQTGQYWVRRYNANGTENGTWTTTNMQGTANYVQAVINESVHIDLRTVAWNTTAGTHQLPRYWVRTDNLDAANYTQTNMSGTPGWVRVDVSENVGGSVIDTPVAVQPYTARVRIDTQTPGAVISYSDPTLEANRRERTTQTGTAGTPFNGNALGVTGAHPSVLSYPQSTPSLPGAEGESVSFTLLQGNTNRYGYIFGLSARASIGGVQSEIVYEKATRSVVVFNFGTVPGNWDRLRTTAAGTGKALQLWLRGGDDTSGQNSIPGFPLSWNERDYTGIRLMTKTNGLSTNTGIWYWMSWEITDTAYFYFIAGTTGDATNGYNVNHGPLDWAWGKNAWAVQQHRYPLYPGGSLEFSTSTEVVNPATATFEFYENFSGSR